LNSIEGQGQTIKENAKKSKKIEGLLSNKSRSLKASVNFRVFVKKL